MDKLRLEREFAERELGPVTIRKHFQRNTKAKDEVCVTFEDKELRDMVLSKASNLANFRGEAGMLLHIPDHLQKLFKAFMSLAYDLKKKNANLRRNIKFDETNLSLYMDLQVEAESPWRRVLPDQALRNAASRPGQSDNGPKNLGYDDILDLLGSSSNASQSGSD